MVEAGVVGVLTLVYGVPQTEALAITLVDRAISVVSIIILGSIAYAVSPIRRGLGIAKAATGSAARPPSATLRRARPDATSWPRRRRALRGGDRGPTGPGHAGTARDRTRPPGRLAVGAPRPVRTGDVDATAPADSCV